MPFFLCNDRVKLLQSVGFAVQEAVNGKDAIKIWKDWRPHLVWMDIRMPVMDGYQATTHIKKSPGGKDTVIIALSASAFEEDRYKVIKHGCNDFVRKPFREAEIFAMIHKHLGVRYVYEEDAPALRTSLFNEMLPDRSLVDFISGLSRELILKLEKATELSDAAMIDQVLEEIRCENVPLAEALSELADNFVYDKILFLVQKVLK